MAAMTTNTPAERKPCRHDSLRLDGTLDCSCLRCGVDGYWHEGHRHDVDHPSGKVLMVLACAPHELDLDRKAYVVYDVGGNTLDSYPNELDAMRMCEDMIS